VAVEEVMLRLGLDFCPLIFKQVQPVDLVVAHLLVEVPVVLPLQVRAMMVAELSEMAVAYIVVVVVVAPGSLEPVIFLASLEQVAPDYHQVSPALR
jgi:hypothetical protein